MKRFFAILVAVLFALTMLSGCNADADAMAGAVADILNAVLGERTNPADGVPAQQDLYTVPPQTTDDAAEPDADGAADVVYGQDYTSPEDVAAYLHAFDELPPNYITKAEARALGWDSERGNLLAATGGKSIGGDHFGNREGGLPDKPGRTWYECDVNYDGGYRGAERILYSSDGLIYYTDDHYNTFTLLYGEE